MKPPLRLLLPLLAAALAAPLAAADAPPLYRDPSQPVEARVEDLLRRLTLEEKVSLLHADSKFSTAGIPRLGIPERWMSDGPHGVREEIGPYTWAKAGRTDDFSTYLPVATALAATWNPDLARAYGTTIGQEARKRGKDIMLGPGLNIQRTPLCGRNFEYMGEDPWLTSRMAVASVLGAQAQDIASCVKHFAANNQEWERRKVDVRMDERTLREIYLPAFRAVVQEGHAWAVMSAYNKFRGEYCSQNGHLLNDILKKEWGFPGIVVSDWAATHDTLGSAFGGLDVEMGSDLPWQDFYFAGPLLAAVRRGEVPEALIDDKARRSLRVMIATHVLDARPPGSINTPAHQGTARKVAEEAIVLLKNEGRALPLDPGRLRSIAVIGENAVRLQAHGGESSELKAFYEVSPLEGILRRVGARLNVTYAAGYGKSADPGALARAVEAARAADVAIVVGGLNHDSGFDCEGADRTSLALPYGQDELIRQVSAANPRTIVVLVNGSPVTMDGWLGRVPALVEAWYPGMEGGNALAAVLFGDVNPSGKLPCTFPRRLEDSPAHALHAYVEEGVEEYKEGLLVGYRWYDTKGIEPLFPFGFGLSYTRFDYSDLAVAPGPGGTAVASFTLTNSGARAGAEVAELYVHEERPRLERPEKELKGFRKVYLQPGESRRVAIALAARAFAYYDPARPGWVAQADDFRILVGSSSRDIRLQGAFRRTETAAVP
ncbi:MAG TPA: glycoside hydrolase family 3 C-terminal domain-containing protein [Opitutaceae bacterium]|nr:glycoside hydrolase family 3 C-terminal domain-containing protein [Opitutaceae bacterium]